MLGKRLAFAKRVAFCKNPLAQKLCALIDTKQTNLALSADVTDCQRVLNLAKELGPEICILKTHIDILQDFTPDFTEELQAIARAQNFLIFEDRKFADIGNTVQQQYAGGIYHIASWADIVNAHSLPGPGIVAGLQEAGLKAGRALLLLAEMSSAGNFFTPDYVQKTVHLARQYPQFVMGFIAQQQLTPEPGWLYLTPGVQLTPGQDSLGQRYVTPELAIVERGTDIVIVGRGITESTDPKAMAQQYRASAWAAYERSLNAH